MRYVVPIICFGVGVGSALAAFGELLQNHSCGGPNSAGIYGMLAGMLLLATFLMLRSKRLMSHE